MAKFNYRPDKVYAYMQKEDQILLTGWHLTVEEALQSLLERHDIREAGEARYLSHVQIVRDKKAVLVAVDLDLEVIEEN